MKSNNPIPTTTIGIDLGDKKHQVCVLDQAGNIREEFSLANDKAGLHRLAKRYPNARVAMEVGTHSPWISRLLAEAGCEVFVANARKLRAIYANERKSDELDARMLARIGRLDVDLLSPVFHTSAEAQVERMAVTLRGQLVEQRKAAVQSVRFLLKSLGERLEACSANAFAKRARAALAGRPELLEVVAPMLVVVETLGAGIKGYEERIEKVSREKYPETALLRGIAGVGPVTALSFVLAIEDPGRFEDVRDVGAWLGLVPRRDQSGETDKALGISKAGNRYLRTLLVQCAHYILGKHGPESDLRRHGLKLVERGGRAAKRKALVAVARKLSVVLLSLWKNGHPYEAMRASAAAPAC